MGADRAHFLVDVTQIWAVSLTLSFSFFVPAFDLESSNRFSRFTKPFCSDAVQVDNGCLLKLALKMLIVFPSAWQLCSGSSRFPYSSG